MRLQTFIARSPMPVSAEALFAWHARPGAFERLAPPWEPIEVVERTGEGLEPGTRVVVRTRIGPLSQTLVAEHTRLEPGVLFEDQLRQGPFAHWVHTHRMLPEGPGRSVLEDRILYALPLGAAGSLVGRPVAERRLERMFAYRHALTRADLERHARYAPARPLTVLVAGASGLIGSALVPFLTTGGHRVRRLVRRAPVRADEVGWDPARGELAPEALEDVDAVINLAGAGIGEARWTPERKALIRQSRAESTRLLAERLARAGGRPRVLLNASAVGYYGPHGEEQLTEQSPPGEDFLAQVCRQWEEATRPAEEAGVRVVRLRLGLVVSGQGGVLERMLPAFRAGVGGRLGRGTQWMSWVSLEDVLGAVLAALATPTLSGPVNVVAPHPLTNADFTRLLARALHRPAVAPLPGVALKALFGEMGEALLLSGQRVRPAVLEAQGFSFLHPTLEQALAFFLGRQPSGASAGPHPSP